MNIDPSTLSALAGAALSLAASYLPGFAGWFAALSPDRKRMVMLAALLLVAAGAYALACLPASLLLPPLSLDGRGAGGEGTTLACDMPGLLALLQCFLAAAMANQAAFSLTPRPAAAHPPRSAGKTPQFDHSH